MLFMFDMGEVIIKGVRTLDKIAKRYNLDYDELRRDYGFYDSPLTEGFMDPNDYYRHMEIKYGIEIDDDIFKTYFTPTLNDCMIDKVDKLRARGHRAVIASNTFKPHWDYIGSIDDTPLSHFDALYASHLIHRAKPDSSFYRYILDEEGYSAENAVFIDDRDENIEGAKRLGIKCYNYLGDDRDADLFFGEWL